jgi:sortase (surface protein transpeptidase)
MPGPGSGGASLRPAATPRTRGRARVAAGASLLALVAVLALAGCTSSPGHPAGAAPSSTATTTSAAAASAAPLPASEPVEVRIPRIDATSTLISVGLNPDETIEVPPIAQPMQAAWYHYSPTPGELGPAVILGHVDGGGQPGIFKRLHELQPGDEVFVKRQDATTARFVVSNVEQIAKADFPTDKVYGDTKEPQLRLITCGGTFDQQRSSYRDNVIVYATLAP